MGNVKLLTVSQVPSKKHCKKKIKNLDPNMTDYTPSRVRPLDVSGYPSLSPPVPDLMWSLDNCMCVLRGCLPNILRPTGAAQLRTCLKDKNFSSS